MRISVCIATYRRAERLDALLDDLRRQELCPDEVVIVDNDAAGSARGVADRHRERGAPFQIRYEVQPQRNIALTRNRTVALASGDWLAFIDDDERAPAFWLRRLVEAAQQLGADAVLAPVIPVVPDNAPAWIRRGRFYDFPRMATGEAVPLNRLRFGNVILRGDVLRAEPGPFDVRYGLITGEDADMLIRLINKGARVVWCDEAVVHEPVEPARLSLQWLLQRAFSGGQEFARKTLGGSYGPVTPTTRINLFMKALLQLAAATALAALILPLGRHHAAQWAIKSAANLGKLSVFWGWTYHEYANVPS
jgi:succinoglycan biosynthesis protein ExoM